MISEYEFGSFNKKKALWFWGTVLAFTRNLSLKDYVDIHVD